MSDRLNTTAKKDQNSDSIFNVNPFQPRGFAVQAKSEESTPASKSELWESYQQAKQLNQGTSRSSIPIQAKLTIGQPGDKYEQEADSVADRVMAMPEPTLAKWSVTNSVQTRSIQTISRVSTDDRAQSKEEPKQEETEQLQTKEKVGQTLEIATTSAKIAEIPNIQLDPTMPAPASGVSLPLTPPPLKELAEQNHIIQQNRVYGILKRGLSIDPNVATYQDNLFHNSAKWIDSGQCQLVVLSPTHDSHSRKEGFTTYFNPRIKYPIIGGSYPNISESDSELEKLTKQNSRDTTFRLDNHAGSMSGEKILSIIDPSRFYPNDKDLQELFIHEVQHDADRHSESQKDGNTSEIAKNFERYKSEFRAYWIANYQEISDDFGLPIPIMGGLFHNQRQEKICNHLKLNYEYVRDSYTKDSSFRGMVHSYAKPTGVNLINSVNIESVNNALANCDSRKNRTSPEVNSVFAEVQKLNRKDALFLSNENYSQPFWERAKNSLSPVIYDEFRRSVPMEL